MEKSMRSFPDDLDSNKESAETRKSADGTRYAELEDKWNAIQEDYINTHPDLEMEDLYFEGGGFEGLLEKISSVRGKTVAEIRSEIENWG